MIIKKCRYCNKKLIPHDHESPNAYKHRVYCNTECAIVGQRKAKHWRDGWLNLPGKGHE